MTRCKVLGADIWKVNDASNDELYMVIAILKEFSSIKSLQRQALTTATQRIFPPYSCLPRHKLVATKSRRAGNHRSYWPSSLFFTDFAMNPAS